MREAALPIDGGGWSRFHEVRPSAASSGPVSVYFDDLESTLCGLIARSEVVVGCVAWLTSDAICNALASRPFVSIIIQKEDWLRPDGEGEGGAWRDELHRRYAAIRGDLTRFHAPMPLGGMSYGADPSIESIRCAGEAGGRSALRCHHKFAVFGSVHNEQIRPESVWSGSYNWTRGGERNLENAMHVRDAVIAEQYLREWSAVAAISEPLDWNARYVNPEWRIGS